MKGFEKRKDKRLAIKLNLLCRKLGAPMSKLHTGTVVNVATGGLYFETTATQFEPGSLTELSIAVPPEVGRLEFGGTMRTIATVVRTETLATSRTGLQAGPVHGVALQFHRRPKLC